MDDTPHSFDIGDGHLREDICLEHFREIPTPLLAPRADGARNDNAMIHACSTGSDVVQSSCSSEL